jgi:hypothetical protein
MSVPKKRKVGTILEVNLLKNLKIQAVEENRPMADLISDAIEMYLGKAHETEGNGPGFRKLLKHPALRASYTDVRAVLEEDIYQRCPNPLIQCPTELVS